MKTALKTVAVVMLLSAVESYAATSWRGDFDGNDSLDLLDMAALASAIRSGETSAVFDLNSDGRVDDADLHVLADYILKDTKIPSTGISIDIGDWGDGGEIIGELKMPAANGKAKEASFSLSDSRFDYGSRAVSNSLTLDSPEPICGLMIALSLPKNVNMDVEAVKRCFSGSALYDNHRLYGEPIVRTDGDVTSVRLIVFSPDLRSMTATQGELTSFDYQWSGTAANAPASFHGSSALTAGSGMLLEMSSESSPRWGYVPLEKINVVPSAESLTVGQTIQLTVEFEPADATDRGISWCSSDESVASVDDSGMVTSHKEGGAEIIATSTDGSSLTSSFTLEIKSGVEAVFDYCCDRIDVYGVSGYILLKDAGKEDFDNLPPGCYIIKAGNVTMKVVK